jgi:hypothetical protein
MNARAAAYFYLNGPETRYVSGRARGEIMDPNLLYALIGAPILFAVVAWIVVYSRRQHQKNIRQTSIRAQESRPENRAG